MEELDCTKENLKGRVTQSKAEADWLKDGGREDVWTRVMMLVCPM